MRHTFLILLCSLPLTPCLVSQTEQQTATVHTASPRHTSLYLAAPPVDFLGVISPPPAIGTAAARDDLAAVYAAQAQRSEAEVRQAQRDDVEEDIFIFSTVLGPKFRAQDLPVTAALSAHVRNEAGTVTPALKDFYRRPRPFVTHDDLHPVCEQKREPGYPSGHTMVGYLEALTLAQIVPSRAAQILRRAGEYAHNRVVCGVHYPSDVAASQTAALVEFGALATSPAFRNEVAKAREEITRVIAVNAADSAQEH